LSLSLALPSRAAKFVQFFSLSPSTFECNPKTGGGAKTSAASRQGRGGKTVAASVLVTQSISICRADREREENVLVIGSFPSQAICRRSSLETSFKNSSICFRCFSSFLFPVGEFKEMNE
jgi:hypothetical protein